MIISLSSSLSHTLKYKIRKARNLLSFLAYRSTQAPMTGGLPGGVRLHRWPAPFLGLRVLHYLSTVPLARQDSWITCVPRGFLPAPPRVRSALIRPGSQAFPPPACSSQGTRSPKTGPAAILTRSSRAPLLCLLVCVFTRAATRIILKDTTLNKKRSDDKIHAV